MLIVKKQMIKSDITKVQILAKKDAKGNSATCQLYQSSGSNNYCAVVVQSGFVSTLKLVQLKIIFADFLAKEMWLISSDMFTVVLSFYA